MYIPIHRADSAKPRLCNKVEASFRQTTLLLSWRLPEDYPTYQFRQLTTFYLDCCPFCTLIRSQASEASATDYLARLRPIWSRDFEYVTICRNAFLMLRGMDVNDINVQKLSTSSN